MTELRDKDIIVPVVRKTADGYRKLGRSNYGHVVPKCIPNFGKLYQEL